jgi:hypothetical protein
MSAPLFIPDTTKDTQHKVVNTQVQNPTEVHIPTPQPNERTLQPLQLPFLPDPLTDHCWEQWALGPTSAPTCEHPKSVAREHAGACELLCAPE